MTVTDLILAGVLAGWWLLSLASQWKGGRIAALRSRDVLHLIPNWRFFAPAPARRDYHLEYRVRTRGAQPTRWRRVELIPARGVLCVVWYPRKRLRKAFNTSVRRLIRMFREHGRDAASRSLAYLHLLNYLQHRHAAVKADALQFRILSSQDFDPDPRPRLVFTSDWHTQ